MELKERLQKLAGIDDIVNKITDIAMKERRKNIIISPKGGFPSSQRFDPTTPLRKKVSFGEDPRKNIGTRNLSLPRERSTLRRLDLERKDATETALDIMNEEKPGRFVNPKTKRIRPPKPTQRQRKEIMQAKLEKMALLRPLILKKKQPKKIKKIPTKSAVLTNDKILAGEPRDLTGSDIIKRFKNTGLGDIEVDNGFIFLPDEGRVTDALKPVDAQHLRNKFKTPSNETLSFVSRSEHKKFVEDIEKDLESIRVEGKTPLISGFNYPDERGFEFDATFAMSSKVDSQVIDELAKTNQQSAIAIEPDLTVRFIVNPRFRITSKTSLR